MRRRLISTGPRASLFAALGCGAALCLSCSVETTRYTAPEALKGKSVPDPPGAVAADNGAAVAERVCTPPEVPDPNCPQKWTDLYTTFINGRWSCTNKSCHGPTSGVAPIISDSNAQVARKQLLNYMMPLDATKQPPKYYLDKCNKDQTASSFLCNIKTESNITTCGSAMPKLGYNNVQGTPATSQDVQRFGAWIACGAPDN